ncbi:MAG: HAD family hydrolase [Anaerolineae bacterium]|nr:HAD family hydrolase [Anaerolineae bacterium]
MSITHVFFDLHGTLVDNKGTLPGQYQAALAAFMAGRYGGDPAAWAAANARVVDDWDSYYADLDFSGDDSLAQFQEGQTRTLRALFRLTGRPYPPSEDMARLVETHRYSVTSRCDALYPDARAALADLRALPLTLGLITHGMRGHAEGLLAGAGVRGWFAGPLMTPDTAGYFGKDEGYFRLAFGAVPPGRCVVVEDRPVHARLAARLGARVVLVDRAGRYASEGAWGAVMADLYGLPALLREWLAEGETP